VTHVTHSHLLTHVTHDPLIHCLLCCDWSVCCCDVVESSRSKHASKLQTLCYCSIPPPCRLQ